MELRLLLGVAPELEELLANEGPLTAPELEELLALKEGSLLLLEVLLDVDMLARFDELLLDEGPNLD